MNQNQQTDKGEEQFRQAAQAYERFLRDNPAERKAMEAWGSAPLADDIKLSGTLSVDPR